MNTMNHTRPANKSFTVVASIVLALASTIEAGCSAGAGAAEAGEDIASAAQAITGNEVTRGQSLTPGSSVQSPDGRLFLAMQTDGNLVLYFSPFGTSFWAEALWASNTGGNPGAWAIMQNDGNFVVYSKSGAPLWATATGPNGSFVKLQNDGNLVVYQATARRSGRRALPRTCLPRACASTMPRTRRSSVRRDPGGGAATHRPSPTAEV
jgi:hypothetical protein